MVYSTWFALLTYGVLHFTLTHFFAGEVRTMFEQEAANALYMDAFFREKPNYAISWLHSLARGRYGTAAQALLQSSEGTTKLEGKHVRWKVFGLSIFRLLIISTS